MKILIIHNPYLHPGGEDEVVHAETEMLRRYGHDVVLYQRRNDEIRMSGWRAKLQFGLRDVYWSRRSYNDVRRLIREHRFDIVHIHNVFYVITPSVYGACRDEGVPVVQTLHNYRFLCPIGTFYRDGHVCEACPQKSRWQAVRHGCFQGSRIKSLQLVKVIDRMEREGAYDVVNHFIALSAFSKEKFVENGFDPRRISVKPNGLTTDPFAAQGVGEGALYVGTLQAYKGIETVLEAWRSRACSVPLRVIGDGPLRSRLEREYSSPVVSFLGHLPSDEVLAQIRSSQMVLIPSECYENFPRILVEAFACGRPVVASRIGALAGLVDDGQTGLLFDPGNHNDLINKVESLAGSEHLLQIMGGKAREKYEQEYTTEANYEQLMAVYARVL